MAERHDSRDSGFGFRLGIDRAAFGDANADGTEETGTPARGRLWCGWCRWCGQCVGLLEGTGRRSRRLGQRLVMRTSSWFLPGLAARVMSARKGGFQRMPRSMPLRRTSAMLHVTEVEVENFVRAHPVGWQLNLFAVRWRSRRSISRRARDAGAREMSSSSVTTRAVRRCRWGDCNSHGPAIAKGGGTTAGAMRRVFPVAVFSS